MDRGKAHEALYPPLREKFPYSDFFWSIFSRIRTEFGLFHFQIAAAIYDF